jgi:hypothetical protein
MLRMTKVVFDNILPKKGGGGKVRRDSLKAIFSHPYILMH